jgi:hypothetical protein
MKPIMPPDDDFSHKPASIGALVAFWRCLHKNGRMTRVLLYIALSLVFLFLLAYLVQDTIDIVLGAYSFPVFIFPLIVLAMFILYAPTMPRLYRVQFSGKFRRDIGEKELNGLLTELAGKSLELIALIIAVTCILCIAVHGAARWLSLPDSVTVLLMAITALDTFLISLLASTLGRDNLAFLQKTYNAEEYTRYSRLSHYKNLLIVLFTINALVAVILLYALLLQEPV